DYYCLLYYSGAVFF
nr:immunoglobulin light chain junction region [Macaca mulatta]MOW66299.1 immunoglobulin light chain junction region [Macaca mulatta]MOW66390.1 immunoglobulin light chain junction region [Macaca mulatta]MOW66408.1 immunoglobulin light chain junction region [Macaca mulatta]MOW66837.1 immunoglobulin light chain junction region [Macaca mulatta]